jgi:hypothetical protein
MREKRAICYAEELRVLLTEAACARWGVLRSIRLHYCIRTHLANFRNLQGSNLQGSSAAMGIETRQCIWSKGIIAVLVLKCKERGINVEIPPTKH